MAGSARCSTNARSGAAAPLLQTWFARSEARLSAQSIGVGLTGRACVAFGGMKTDSLRVNALSPDAYEWYLEYLDALDNQDIDRYGEFLADSVVLQQNNDDPVSGKETVLEGSAPTGRASARSSTIS